MFMDQRKNPSKLFFMKIQRITKFNTKFLSLVLEIIFLSYGGTIMLYEATKIFINEP